MKHFDIYMEGYTISGGHGKAMLIKEGMQAESFEEACRAFAVTKDGKKYGSFREYQRFGETIQILWGCRLFDNLKEAQESFG